MQDDPPHFYALLFIKTGKVRIMMSRETKMYQLVLTRPNGSQISTIRTQAIGTQSHCLDTDTDNDVKGALAILMQLLLDEATTGCFKKFNRTGMPFEVWKLILSFNLIPGATYVKSLIAGSNTPYIEPIEQLGAVAICLKKPSFFPRIKNSNAVIEAVLHADEEMVLKMVQADPQCLTRSDTAIDLQGNSFTGTPFQAALHTTDVQLCEKMKPTFSQINHGQMEMERQFKEIYTSSLRMYWEKQETEIDYLKSLKNKGQAVDHLIARAQYRSDLYLTALQRDYISLILKTHDQAQEDNAFDFTPYINAIVNATQAELDDVMELIIATGPAATAVAIARTGVSPTQTDAARAKPFDKLTLVEKLNRFREEFVAHTQPEIIFNPHHFLTGLKHNEKTWDEVDAGRIPDPNYKMCIVIFFQLVGWAQRKAAEPVKQDIRQGIYYFPEKEGARARPAGFNALDPNYRVIRNSLDDVSLVDSSLIDGIGYKLAAPASCWPFMLPHSAPWTFTPWRRRPPGIPGHTFFQNSCREKTPCLENLFVKLIAPAKSHQS